MRLGRFSKPVSDGVLRSSFHPCLRVWLLIFCALHVVAPGLRGQWLTQPVPLQPGWNAIYLPVQPSPAACDDQFTGLPITAVQRYNQRVRVAQFDEDPTQLFARPAEWLTWRPNDGTNNYIRTLENLVGDAAYLIYATTGCTWVVAGRPVLPQIEWVAGSANMVGFQVSPDPGQRPTFADFFRYDPGIDATPNPSEERIYSIGTQLQHVNLTGRTTREVIAPGKAYWVYAQGLSDYTGGLEVYAGDAEGLVYGDDFNELVLRIRNVFGAPTTVTVRHVVSATAPANTPRLVAEVPLLWADRADGGWAWQRWPTVSGVASRQLGTNEVWEIRLALDRSGMSEPFPSDALWQSLIQVSSSCGSRHYVPVSAAYAQGTDQVAAYPSGLWVGQADLTHVGFVGFDTNAAGELPLAPQPVSSPFSLRLILHAGSDGSVKLLERALVATLQDVAGNVINRLFTDESRVPASASVTTRLSSPAFGRIPPVTLAGAGFLQTVEGTFVVDYDDPANPFKHLYHPDHDNLDPVTGGKLAEGVESFSITNHLRLTWSTNSVGGPFTALWNPDETTTGMYEQVISNLRHVPITLRGEFVLKRVSRVGRAD